ncbi:death-on-curing protein [Natrinema hispanicum]|uniref:Death-on-curing protein n=2 Tax=Natrinema hispanicum TaxID=392421 RepID=A0A482Y4M9_9EURY|nr:type II toxin-antitoxin system death-on-curing family toxin [Natrinema hispanicum]RZV06523.1 death-on-curing protein [Natrinema hispanicum]
MMDEEPESISYLSADDIRDIHELIVESNADTTAGVSSPGDIEYAVEHIQEGHFGQVPQSLHEKSFQLLRLIAANHPFVDGNKRTALMSTRIFYALNGLRFDYDRTIKEILKELAIDESSVDVDNVISYLQEHTEPLAPEYEATINLWLSRIEGTDQLPSNHEQNTTDDGTAHEPNDYDDDPHSEK